MERENPDRRANFPRDRPGADVTQYGCCGVRMDEKRVMPETPEMKRRLAGLLLAKSYREGEFILTSGRKSDYYFDGKQTALHPEGAWLIGHLFLRLLADVPALAGVGGMTLGADPLVAATSVISHEMGRPLAGLIVRKNAKGHGTNQYLEGLGNLPPGAAVAMLEDVVTTGSSLLTACGRVREAGFTIGAVCALLDREEGGRETLAAAGFSLRALFRRAELLALARENSS